MSSSRACLIAGALPLIVLLAGCASSATETGPVRESHVVVGSGSPEDRQAIEESNRQILQTEQGIVSTPATTSPPASKPSTPP